MRYKDGAPVTLYVLVDQTTGNVEPVEPNRLAAARKWLKVDKKFGFNRVIAAYTLKEVK